MEFRPDHVRGSVSMCATRAATFNAGSLEPQWCSAALLPGLQGCRVLSDESKFRRFLEMDFSPLSFKDLSVFDFGPSSTPISGCGDPSVVTNEFKDALLVALERAELVFMCYFGEGFEGFSAPLSRRLKGRDQVLYTLPDVFLNYWVQSCIAGFSYSVRNGTAPEGAVWYGDIPSAARLRGFFQRWADSVSDLSNSTVASCRMQILPQLSFGGGKHARTEDSNQSKDKSKSKKKKKKKSEKNGWAAQNNATSGSGSTASAAKSGPGSFGGTSSSSKGSSSSTAKSAGSGSSGGSSASKSYCVYKLAELFGLQTLGGQGFVCKMTACTKAHPASKQEVDKDEAKKAVKAVPHLKGGPELLKLIA